MAVPTQPKCLVFDLEVVPEEAGQPARIIKLGALRPDTGEELELDTPSPARLEAALQQLERLGEGASFLLGHNLLAHDLPLLEAIAPQLALLRLPAIDTLRLSPLAFPQNPYHRLIKDYKLIRASLNSPLADCRATLTLFIDQQQAFRRLDESHPAELLCYQALIAPQIGAGLGNFFMHMSGQRPLPVARLGEWLPGLLREDDTALARDLKVCRSRLQRLIDEDLRQPHRHWPLAYALAWLRVAGGNSVLAPWVRHQFPEVSTLIGELRDQPCSDPACQYCRSAHDPRHELKRYFGFDDFRRQADGSSAQHDIVLAGMQGHSVLAVLATGGGKSLCYQLPALNRYHRNGSLTVIVSPLQSLMKDQVDGLLARNVQCAAALNGLLTLPERADVLEKIQLGDVGLLLVSPEQFRNKALRSALTQRQIGAWIFDEAHCLSKWGNDFRPDYLYVARFIREFSGANPLAPVGCFTATAKPDVLEDICSHFRAELGIEFRQFIGTPERSNLSFEVQPVAAGEKWPRTHQLLEDELGGRDGGAVVFVASRKNAEGLGEFLQRQDWACRHFHAGLQPHEKKDIQDAFKDGRLRVIVATNAFGMGVDKQDVRLVVHADIPGSLENYLQEAGRAGRDQQQARCVLLYDPQDIETQFGLSERAQLSQRDIQQILKKLREEHRRRKGSHLVISAGEVLQGVQISFDADDRDAETKVVTAIAWLERARFLRREENHTRVFPARLKHSQEDAEARLKRAELPARRLEEFRAILEFLYAAEADERVNTDRLMTLTGQTAEEVAGSLRQLEDLDLLENDTQLTLYLRHATADASVVRLNQSLQLEEALLATLAELAPDAEQGDWQDLHLPSLTSRLRESAELAELLPLHILRLLHSLAQDRDGDRQQGSSLELRQLNRDYLKLRLRNGYGWRQVAELGDKRRAIAGVLLPFLVGKLPAGARGKDLLVTTTFGELRGLLEADLELGPRIKPEQRQSALEHVLLYLHQQEVLTLNHGMTVMRRAMTISIDPARDKQHYLKEDFQRLDEHYRERRIQVHVMREYAEIALGEMAAALNLVLHYFQDSKQAFLRRYFAGKDKVLALATSEASWRAITGPLNDTQREIVTDGERNRLILAGPGSGKTRVIVHRIAYLLRVRRVPASAIIALTFNRHAANEIRRRMRELVGAEAFGLTVLTYHAMAMRLTGTRFARREKVSQAELEALLERAADLLEGRDQVEGEEDDLRERLLRGYRYILVDEYQDIDERQYRLVSALAQARRRSDEGDADLCILAVGDDDQNIYQWRGGSNRYIERYREQYGAEISYLVENYRSSQAIIAAANRLIAANPARLKAEQPIRIDQQRENEAHGGRWQALDPHNRGRVLRLHLPASDRESGNQQAQAVLGELQRLLELEGQRDWQGCAVLARSHSYLQPLQAWCEQQGVAYQLADDQNSLPLTRQRGFVRAIEWLRAGEEFEVAGLRERLAELAPEAEWQAFFTTALEQLQGELGDCRLARGTLIDWLYEYAHELRQQPRAGLYLGTVHSAKGLEFRHVALLDGDWLRPGAKTEEERRLYYVGMTRARETLTLADFRPGNPLCAALTGELQEQAFSGQHESRLALRYRTLGLGDIDLGFAGRQSAQAPIHAAIAALEPGDPLTLEPDGERYLILDRQGHCVGRTARSFQLDFDLQHCAVAELITRYADDGAEEFRQRLKCAQWEIVVPRLRGR